MKIKNFNNYIKESISINQVESNHLMYNIFDRQKLRIHPDEIVDSLEIVDVKSTYYKYQHFIWLTDRKGKNITLVTEKTFDKQLYIKQSFYLEVEIMKQTNAVTAVGHLFKQPITEDEMNSFLTKLSDTKSKVKSIFERFYSNKVIDINYKFNISKNDKDNDRTINLLYEINILEEADNNYIKQLFNDFINSKLTQKINETIIKLQLMYKDKGVENPNLDINHDDLASDSKIVMIGFFGDDEIYVVATVDKENFNVKINYEEFYRSLQN